MRRSSYYIEDCCVKGRGDLLIVLLPVMRIASALTRPVNTTTVQVLKTMFRVSIYLAEEVTSCTTSNTREKDTTLLILPFAEIWQIVIAIENEVLEPRTLLIQMGLNLTLYIYIYIYLFRTKVTLTSI